MTDPLVRSLRFRPSAQAVVLFAVLGGPGIAHAQAVGDDAGDTSLARQLGNRGLELAKSGDCAAAVDPLARSEALHHAPTTLTVLGECHIALGHLVQGAEELTRVVRENLDAHAPPAYAAAQERARHKLDETQPRVPHLKVLVSGPPPDAALVVALDGKNLALASVGVERPVDPGPHKLEARAPGYLPATAETTLHEGATQTLTLTLAPVPNEPAAPVPSSSASLTPARRRDNLPTYLAFGVAAAAAATGAVFGVVTLSKTSSLDSECPTRSTCPPSKQDEINSAKTTALISNVVFGVSLVSAVVGLYFALRPSGGESPSTPAAQRGLEAHPAVGLGSLGLAGSF